MMMIPFRPIARILASSVHPSPKVNLEALNEILLRFNSNESQGILITTNHYTAPDFQVWWSVILVSAMVPWKIHWIVTSGWTNSGWMTKVTHWLFPLGAKWLGFTAMPAMPPDPGEVVERAEAVKKVIRYAKRIPQPVVGIMPEGRDIPGGILGDLPRGVGRFMQLLSENCPWILPIGVWKEGGQIQVNFGELYNLQAKVGLSAQERDQRVGTTVMQNIASCLPVGLRGKYG